MNAGRNRKRYEHAINSKLRQHGWMQQGWM
jgi:hypothetical protein